MKRILLSATVFLVLYASVEQRSGAQDQQQPVAKSKHETLQVAQESKPTDQGDPRPQLHQRYPRYRIQANDLLDLTFRFTPEFNQEVMIQPDGYIQLKGLMNDIHAQGMTVAELIDALQKAYSAILQDPVINVLLKDFDKPYFIAGGFVGKPGKYDLRGTTTATQAIAIAGGFTDGAKNSQVVLFRRYSDEWVETKTLNLKEILKGKKLSEDTVLQPGDMLFVPKSTFAKIDKFLPRTSLGTYFNPTTF
jgi:polysaccharide export outer membrane protein